MKPPLYIRPLTPEERQQLEAGRHSSDAFTLRRCQILLASARGQRPAQMAQQLSCATPSVRHAIHAFHIRGLAALAARSRRPKRTRAVLDASPPARAASGLWQAPQYLDAACSGGRLLGAGVDPVPGEPRDHPPSAPAAGRELAARQALDHQPRSPLCVKKKHRDHLMRLAAPPADWVLGCADETWWSRLAQPALHSWTGGLPLRLIEQDCPKGDSDPKALACYGLLRLDSHEVLLRCVDGRPVSHVTTAFLAWLCQQLAAERKRVLVLLWDNASWHISREVRPWVRAHNQHVKQHGGIRLLIWRLPIKSPRLNPIEPHWVQGQRAIVEPARLLSATEIITRVCAYFDCEHVAHLTQRVA